jgi:lipid II:glycine glycyltransferase (peptidoglycan interpeptide bridge formation enzyme)
METAARDGIAIHSRSYYADLIREADNRVRTPYDGEVSVRVYLAEFEGSPLAAIITLFAGREAVYLYGASSNEHRNLMPAYALQWRAIRDAREAGCERYDFYGIPPTDDPHHPMHGLYRFKTGFGGTIAHRVGSYDIPLKPLAYALFTLAERARAFWFKRVMKWFRRETPPRS